MVYERDGAGGHQQQQQPEQQRPRDHKRWRARPEAYTRIRGDRGAHRMHARLTVAPLHGPEWAAVVSFA
jgi:hypothetical protein